MWFFPQVSADDSATNIDIFLPCVQVRFFLLVSANNSVEGKIKLIKIHFWDWILFLHVECGHSSNWFCLFSSSICTSYKGLLLYWKHLIRWLTIERAFWDQKTLISILSQFGSESYKKIDKSLTKNFTLNLES